MSIFEYSDAGYVCSAISFSARLEENPDHTDSVMSVKLDATDR